MEKRGSGLTRICNKTKALEGYKDKLKPVFKSTPTQFQTIIFASSDTSNVGHKSETCRRRNLLSVNRKYSILSKGLRQSLGNKCRRLCR